MERTDDALIVLGDRAVRARGAARGHELLLCCCLRTQGGKGHQRRLRGCSAAEAAAGRSRLGGWAKAAGASRLPAAAWLWMSVCSGWGPPGRTGRGADLRLRLRHALRRRRLRRLRPGLGALARGGGESKSNQAAPRRRMRRRGRPQTTPGGAEPSDGEAAGGGAGDIKKSPWPPSSSAATRRRAGGWRSPHGWRRCGEGAGRVEEAPRVR